MTSHKATDTYRFGYPRPQLERDWESLNGAWQFAFDPEAALSTPDQVNWTHTIQVPFAPETPMSGINQTGFFKAVWYRLQRKAPSLKPSERLILHFGAVDFAATVWMNGREVKKHEGGYTPFFVDITPYLAGGPDALQTIEVRAFDNPHDFEQNRGKQDWLVDAHGIWYPRTTGIWQTVWWEVVNDTHIAYIGWQPSMQDWTIEIDMEVTGPRVDGLMFRVDLECNGRQLARNIFGFTQHELQIGRVKRQIRLADIDRMWLIPENPWRELNEWLVWSPEHPNLIQARVRLITDTGAAMDEVASYTAFRSFQRRGNQLYLNGAPISDRFRNGPKPGMLRLALEQGYWRESGMTPPNDEAIERDVLLAKSTFHGVRKHNKIEDPRYLYWADVHGLLVWEELPSAYLFSPLSAQRSAALWMEAIRRDKNHPCIIAWVPINESWQVPQLEPDTPEAEAQRQYVTMMYHMTKSLTRNAVVVGNDGWEMPVSDIIAIHDYHWNPVVIRDRYANNDEAKSHLFANERPGGKKLLVGDMDWRNKPIGLTEFGGIALSSKPGDWGYSTAVSPEDLRDRFVLLMDAVTSLESMSVFCYTELYDVYQEANGLFTMDRQPKFDVEVMRAAVFGDPIPAPAKV